MISWFWRSPPQQDNSNNVKRDPSKEDADTLEERDGARYLRMIASVNKVAATSIKSGLCTGPIGWIVNGVACPSDSSTVSVAHQHRSYTSFLTSYELY
jgi:hypothetical protein